MRGQLPSTLWSYLSQGRVDIEVVSVEDAKIELVTGKDGNTSWDLPAPRSGAPGSQPVLVLHELNIKGGSKLYHTNHQHLCNRIEVAGLFWHLVDLIWIYLFPFLYLID